MTNLQQAAQQALEALEGELLKMLDKPEDEQYRVKYAYLLTVITALRTALAQQAEPTCPECKAKVLFECVACSSNNYPPKRPWVGLTDEDWEKVANRKNTVFDTFEQGATWAAYKLERRNT